MKLQKQKRGRIDKNENFKNLSWTYMGKTQGNPLKYASNFVMYSEMK